MMLNEQTKKWNVQHDAEMTVKAAMVQASISSPRGALYFAGEATPYNLENLRAHVRALRDSARESTCLSLNLGAGSDAVVVAEIETLADELTREGIEVRFWAAVDQSEPRSATADRVSPSPPLFRNREPEGARGFDPKPATGAAVTASSATNDLIFTPKSPPDRTSRSATISTVRTGSR